MLDRRFREASDAGYVLYTLVVRPPTNYHWIEGRAKFHQKVRDNIRVKYGCECYYRHYDEFDARQKVHSHYIFVTNAPLDLDQFKATIRGLLAKVWAWVEKAMPPTLRRGHEDFFWDTQPWLAVEDDDAFDWSVYCQPPHNPTGLAKYLPKDLKDRRGVQPVPDGWPLNIRGGRGFFGQPIRDYWRATYGQWYPREQGPGAPDTPTGAGDGISQPEWSEEHERLERTEEGTGSGRGASVRLRHVPGVDRRAGEPGGPGLHLLVRVEREDAARPGERRPEGDAAGAAGVTGPSNTNRPTAALPGLSASNAHRGPAQRLLSPYRFEHDPRHHRHEVGNVIGVPAVVRRHRVRQPQEHVHNLARDPPHRAVVARHQPGLGDGWGGRLGGHPIGIP